MIAQAGRRGELPADPASHGSSGRLQTGLPVREGPRPAGSGGTANRAMRGSSARHRAGRPSGNTGP